MPQSNPSKISSEFRRRLRTWYRTHGRHDLPWRGAFAPYRVLVSEFMLQQTTVATVLPYFHRFLQSFPTVDHLARAPLEKVLKHWAGLGYYARARHLHKTAHVLVRDHGSKVPTTRQQAEGLPGVGPYTAGALLSFAYDLPEALVDGNVIRVLSRIFGIKGESRRPDVLEKIWAIARGLVPKKGARHFNSALMDFGATVCKPGLPDCPRCPLASLCWAQRHGWVDRLPASRPDKAKRVIPLTAFRVEKDDHILLHRRSLGGLWGGLWELPTVEGRVNKDMSLDVSGEKIKPIRPLGSFRHILSHRDLRVEIWEGRLGQPGFFNRTRHSTKGARWATKREAQKMAISKLTRTLLSIE